MEYETNKIINRYYLIVLIIGMLIGIIISFISGVFVEETQASVNEPDAIIGGRGFIETCPDACYDEISNSIIIFERTQNNLNIHQNTEENFVKTDHFVTTKYWKHNNYYYADVDDVVTN